MSMKPFSLILSLNLVAMLTCFWGGLAAQADNTKQGHTASRWHNWAQKSKSHSGSVSTSRGGQGVFKHSQTGNKHEYERSFSTAQGKQYSHSGAGEYNPETKTYTGRRTFTGPGGKETNINVQKQLTGNGSQVNTYTGANGKTSQVKIDRKYDQESGVFTKTYTGNKGNTLTETHHYDPVSKTYTKQVAGQDGKLITEKVIFDPKTKSYQRQLIGQDGKVISVNRQYDPSAKTLNGTLSGPNGETASFSDQKIYDPKTGKYSYVRTLPSGETISVSPEE